MRVLVIKNWDEYQHYKDRNAPWIKFYRDTLTSETWVLGTDASRLVQCASTLLALRYNNATPYNFELIKRVAHLSCTEREFDKAIAHLTAYGFLEIQEVEDACKQTASTMLATCTSEREGEKNRIEGEKRESSRASRRCPSNFEVSQDMRDWAREHCPGVEIDAATAAFRDHQFRDSKSDWPATWRNWMRREKPTAPNGRRLTKYEESMRALDAWRTDDARPDETALAIAGPNVG